LLIHKYGLNLQSSTCRLPMNHLLKNCLSFDFEKPLRDVELDSAKWRCMKDDKEWRLKKESEILRFKEKLSFLNLIPWKLKKNASFKWKELFETFSAFFLCKTKELLSSYFEIKEDQLYFHKNNFQRLPNGRQQFLSVNSQLFQD